MSHAILTRWKTNLSYSLLCNSSAATIHISLNIFYSNILYIFFFFEHIYICRHIQLTPMHMNRTYGIVMKVITYTLVMFVIPFVTLIVVNTCIVIALRRSSSLHISHVRRPSPTNNLRNTLVFYCLTIFIIITNVY